MSCLYDIGENLSPGLLRVEDNQKNKSLAYLACHCFTKTRMGEGTSGTGQSGAQNRAPAESVFYLLNKPLLFPPGARLD